MPALAALRSVRGVFALAHRLFGPGSRQSRLVRVRYGRGVIDLDPASYIDWNIHLFGDYERSEKRVFLKLFDDRPRRTLIDIGANIGAHALTFARSFETVLAVEPNPEMHDRLVRNIALSPAGNIRTVHAGFGAETALLRFYQPTGDNKGTGTFDLSLAPPVDARREVDLPVRIGDDVLAEIGSLAPIDAIKIDVQGFEPDVLRGLRRTLAEHRPIVWFELSSATLARLGSGGGLNALIPYGFDLYRFCNRRSLGLIDRVTLELHSGELCEGDYVVMPKATP